MASLTLIHNFTYQAKTTIKSLGGKWDSAAQGWNMPDQRAYDLGLLACLEAELSHLNEEESDPKIQGGDLDAVQAEWLRVKSKIDVLKQKINLSTENIELTDREKAILKIKEYGLSIDESRIKQNPIVILEYGEKYQRPYWESKAYYFNEYEISLIENLRSKNKI